MKEVKLEVVLDKHFKKKDTCTMQELYHAVENYRKKHNVYVEYNNDTLIWTINVNADKFYWCHKDDLIHKQESHICHCCGSKHYKYPDVEKFNKIIKFHKKVISWQMQSTKVKKPSD
jgi:hypothetical protein